MLSRAKAIGFDVDADSLVRLREAFPDWEVEAASGDTPGTPRPRSSSCWGAPRAARRGRRWPRAPMAAWSSRCGTVS
jgi:hypothetical protein